MPIPLVILTLRTSDIAAAQAVSFSGPRTEALPDSKKRFLSQLQQIQANGGAGSLDGLGLGGGSSVPASPQRSGPLFACAGSGHQSLGALPCPALCDPRSLWLSSCQLRQGADASADSGDCRIAFLPSSQPEGPCIRNLLSSILQVGAQNHTQVQPQS